MIDSLVELHPSLGDSKIDYDVILNPNGSIPRVILDEQPVQEGRTRKDFAIKKSNNENVGNVALSKDGDTRVYITDIFIDEERRKQGYAKSTYIELLKYLKDAKLESGFINKPTRGIWEWLVEKGVAKHVKNEGLGQYEVV